MLVDRTQTLVCHGGTQVVVSDDWTVMRSAQALPCQDTLTGAKPSSVELPERLYSTLVLVIVIAAALLMRTFLRH